MRNGISMNNYKGDVVLRIPPSETSRRNSDGAFIELKDKSIMLVYTRYTGNSGIDDAKADLYCRYSYDHGKNWNSQDRLLIACDEHRAKNIMSASLLRMQNGCLGIIYSIRYGISDYRPYIRTSGDEGVTWNAPVCCVPGPGYYVTNHDRAIQLSTGRILVPAAYHKMCGEDNGNLDSLGTDSLDRRGTACFFYSDDGGLSWKEANNFHTLPAMKHTRGLQEPGVIELKNGCLWAWCRTDIGYQYELFSFDNGESWTPPTPSIFASPCSPLSMKRLIDGSTLIAVWNPKTDSLKPWSENKKTTTGGRTPLIYSTSKDDGKTWSEYRILEDKPDDSFCYTAIYPLNEAVLLGYWQGGKSLVVRRIMIQDL